MKTLDVDSLTNSAVMAVAKELSKNGIDLYRVDPNSMLRNLLAPYLASIVADFRTQTLKAMTSDQHPMD